MEEKERVMGPFGRLCFTYAILIMALVSVDLLYGYLLGPAGQYTQIGLHVLAVVLVFWLADAIQARRLYRLQQTEARRGRLASSSVSKT